MSFPCGKHHRRRRDCYRATEQPLSHLTVTAPLAQGSRKRRSLPIGTKSVHTGMRRLSPAASSPSPLGEGAELASADEGMQAAGTAQCDALLCFAQSLISRLRRQLPHRGSRRATPREAEERHKLLHPRTKRLLTPAVEQPLFCFCLLDIPLADLRNHAGDLADHVMDHQCVFVG